MRNLLTLALLGSMGCEPPLPAPKCNGSERLCALRFDEVSYATSHNAMANRAAGFEPPNQLLSLRAQLELGARGLMLDTYLEEGEVWLCHGACWLGKMRLLGALDTLNDFLDDHPQEVVTLIIESYVGAAKTADIFADSNIFERLHIQKNGDPWPRLAEMIERDERVVVLTSDDDSARPAWLHHSYDYAWENPYAAAAPDELSCDPDRGDPNQSLWIFNHFLTAPLADPSLAELINHNPEFMQRVEDCAFVRGDRPNFVTVDFLSIGDTLAVVDALNAP